MYIKSNDLEYYKNGTTKKSNLFKRIYISEIMKQMSDGEHYEIKDIYVGKEKKLKTRLILYKLTSDQLKKRSRKCKKNAKKKGIKKSNNTIELLGISIYITNVKQEVLTAEQVHGFYSLRWQVEIIFKTWRFIFHIHDVKQVKIERFQCQLYGKLMLLLLSSTVMFKMRTLVLQNKKLETSEMKASEIVHEYIDCLYFELIKFPSETFNTLKLVFQNVVSNGLKSHATGKLMLTIIGDIATFERECMLESQAEGIAIAKQSRKYKWRKKIGFPVNWVEIYNQYKHREITGTKAMEILNLKRNIFMV